MATIYLTEEVVEELDKQIEEYNSKNPATDRSGYLLYKLTNKK